MIDGPIYLKRNKVHFVNDTKVHILFDTARSHSMLSRASDYA